MKICIVTAGLLPVPDVRGGAIERLMTMIADVNEKEHRLEITIVTQFNKKAVDEDLKNEYDAVMATDLYDVILFSYSDLRNECN